MPSQRSELSPYPVTVAEVCRRFSFSQERRTILDGWLRLRQGLRILGYVHGFQWLDGSFMEDVETHADRAPGDIDVVSFLSSSELQASQMDATLLGVLSNRTATKGHFHVDHFIVPLNAPGIAIVEQTRYWCGLFSHRRLDNIWKGMLKVEICSQAEDDSARQHIQSGVTV